MKTSVNNTYEADGLVHDVAREGDMLPVGASIARIPLGAEVPTGSDDKPVAEQAAGLDRANGGEAGNPVPSLGGSSLAVRRLVDRPREGLAARAACPARAGRRARWSQQTTPLIA